jgi:hypothetical protein
MRNSLESFGRIVSRSRSLAEVLILEREHNLAIKFGELDLLVGNLLRKGLCGDRVVELGQDALCVDRVFILGLGEAERKLMDEWFAAEKQNARGLWTLPEKVSLRVGFASLKWAYKRWGRFGTGPAIEERGTVKLGTAPDNVLYWSILDDLFNTLCIPFGLRGPQTGKLTREVQLENWVQADAMYQALGFEIGDQLSVLRYGGGWPKLNSSERLQAKLRLLDALGQQANVRMAERYRAYRVLPLITNYYNEAKKDGQVKRKQALTKTLERTLSAYWGGDWLSFLDYIGEDPHPDEQITTALPRTKPMVRTSERIEEIAARQGLPTAVVKSVAASYWLETGGSSPVERRVRCLKKYWQIFDNLHRRQTNDAQSLWGLVTYKRHTTVSRVDSPTFHRNLHLELLPEDLLLEIIHLWGTTMNPLWPDRILSEPYPYQAMVDTLGPALKFFEGCSLTGWFLCETGSGRPDMKGLAHYHRKEVAALEEIGTPIDQEFFSELIEAETKLGLLVRIEEEVSRTDQGTPSATFGMRTRFRRSGSEELRDAVTRYRRIWTEKHLEAYLRARWECEITEAGRAYNLLVQDRDGRVPRLSQFAKAAAAATNHWFGGNVCGLYTAIREKCPAEPKQVQLMPADVIGFAKRLYESLPSQPFLLPDGTYPSSYRLAEYMEEVANLGIKYIQMEEGLGRPPEMKELGKKFPHYSKAMPGDLHEAWEGFVKKVKGAREFVLNSTPIGEEEESPTTTKGEA